MVTIAPRSEIEGLAREEYRRKFGSVPEPQVINIEPLITLHAPRQFTWGGVGYRAPPVSYPLGVRLLVAADALCAYRKARAPTPLVRSAIRTAARFIRRAIQPVGIRARCILAFRPCPFGHGDAGAVEGLLRWLIDTSDESPIVGVTERVTVDLLDGLATFCRQFPAWVGPDGWPISYAHYLYGTRHLGRVAARDDLRNASAQRMAQADKDGWLAWATDLRSRAGWSNG